jgi:hypothetical protein
MGLRNSEGKPFFSIDYVMDRFSGISSQDRLDNEKAKKKRGEKKKQKEEGEEFKL